MKTSSLTHSHGGDDWPSKNKHSNKRIRLKKTTESILNNIQYVNRISVSNSTQLKLRKVLCHNCFCVIHLYSCGVTARAFNTSCQQNVDKLVFTLKGNMSWIIHGIICFSLIVVFDLNEHGNVLGQRSHFSSTGQGMSCCHYYYHYTSGAIFAFHWNPLILVAFG